jgi:hypothetical protein
MIGRSATIGDTRSSRSVATSSVTSPGEFASSCTVPPPSLPSTFAVMERSRIVMSALASRSVPIAAATARAPPLTFRLPVIRVPARSARSASTIPASDASAPAEPGATFGRIAVIGATSNCLVVIAPVTAAS